MKTLTFIFDCLVNIVGTSLLLTEKVLRETQIVACLRTIAQTVTVWYPRALSNTYELLERLLKVILAPK